MQQRRRRYLLILALLLLLAIVFSVCWWSGSDTGAVGTTTTSVLGPDDPATTTTLVPGATTTVTTLVPGATTTLTTLVPGATTTSTTLVPGATTTSTTTPGGHVNLLCDDSVLVTEWVWNLADGRVDAVVIGDIDAACLGAEIGANVTDASGDVIASTEIVPIGGSEATLRFLATRPRIADIEGIEVFTVGPGSP